MDEDLAGAFNDELESSEDPKICSECEREFQGEGDTCSECEGEEEKDDME
jgi:predicted amidophosphoribosyltransferase